MIQKIKNLILAVSLLFTFAVPVVAPAATYAATTEQTSINNNLCGGSNFDLSGDTKSTDKCKDTDNNSLSARIRTLLNVLSAVIGIIAVIMIIYAGFRYVTSAGSEGGVKAAKNAIVYAIIGLVVVALAQVIVHFVIANVT
jgi:hypothetical protein